MEPFDFSRRRPLDPVTAGAVQEALSRVAARAALVLASLVRRPASGRCGELLEATSSELHRPDRQWLRLSGQYGEVVLAPQRGVLTGLAEVFMGGPASLPERGPTPLELTVVLPRLAEILSGVPPVLHQGQATGRVEPLDRDSVRQLGPVVIVPFVIELDGVAYDLAVVLARSAVEGDEHADLPPPPVDIEEAVARVPLEVEFAFAPMRVAATDLEDLEVGDVLRLDHAHNEPLTGRVGGRPMLRVVPGRPGRHLTVQVTEILNGDRFDAERAS